MQTTLLGSVSLFGIKPELLLILTCFFLLYYRANVALSATFVLGLISDAYSLAPFGLNTLSFMLLAALLLKVRGELAESNALTWCIVLAFASLLQGLLHIAVLRLVLWEPMPVPASIEKLVFSMFVNALVGTGLFIVFSSLGKVGMGSVWGRPKDRRAKISIRRAY